MRYAGYRRTGPGRSGTATPSTRPERDTVDLIEQAARTQRYWMLIPEHDHWTLRRLDDTTGQLGPAEHTSTPMSGDDAVEWADALVEVTGWDHGWGGLSPRFPGAYIDRAYNLVRRIARTPRPGRAILVRLETDPHLPGMTLLVVREQWTATGQVSDPLTFCEYTGFAGEADMLQRVADWYGLDPARWVTLAAGQQWHHPAGPA